MQWEKILFLRSEQKVYGNTLDLNLDLSPDSVLDLDFTWKQVVNVSIFYLLERLNIFKATQSTSFVKVLTQFISLVPHFTIKRKKKSNGTINT